MIRAIGLATAFGLLAACGADGPPITPAKKASALTVTGEASIGLAVNGTK